MYFLESAGEGGGANQEAFGMERQCRGGMIDGRTSCEIILWQCRRRRISKRIRTPLPPFKRQIPAASMPYPISSEANSLEMPKAAALYPSTPISLPLASGTVLYDGSLGINLTRTSSLPPQPPPLLLPNQQNQRPSPWCPSAASARASGPSSKSSIAERRSCGVR